MATKDYLKFRNSIKGDVNLNLEEGYMLEVLFDYYNVNLGYAYPSYEILMQDLKTKRRAKVSKLLKTLVAKGYIVIEKSGKKNIYNIVKYLYISENNTNKPKEVKTVDSNGEVPIKGQVHIDELENEGVQLIATETGFNESECKKLLNKARNNVKKVMDSFKYIVSKENVKSPFNYTMYILQNNIPTENTSYKTNKFNNFEGRKYNWDALEKKLLGYDYEGSIYV